MDLVKNINNVSTCIYKDYTGEIIKQEFKCIECNNTLLYRHKRQYGLSFWEGNFVCLKCKKEINYYSDDWIKTNLSVKQLELF